MKSAKTILILASVLFAAVCLRAYSAEQDDAGTAKVVPIPVRATRTPSFPGQVIEEEAPIPKPTTRTPVRVTPPRAPSTRTPSRTTPTRPTARTAPTRPSAITRPTLVRRRPAEDPHKDSVILVEAFMVQIRLSSLRSLGVPQISEGCKSVSAEHIIKLMKTTDAAEITAGAKLALGQSRSAATEAITRKAVYKGAPGKMRVEYADVGTSFTAVAEIKREEKIFVELDFEHSTVQPASPSTKESRIVKRTWDSYVYLKTGKPTLVGSTQDKETGTFLIVTAKIQK